MEQLTIYEFNKLLQTDKSDPWGAFILYFIQGWCGYHQKNNIKQSDGNYWSGYLTHESISEQTGVNLKTVKRRMKYFVDSGILIVGNFGKKSYDKRRWYRIDYETLKSLSRGLRVPMKGTDSPSLGDSQGHTITNISNNISDNKSIIDNTGIDTGQNQLLKQLNNAENELVKKLQLNFIKKVAGEPKSKHKSNLKLYYDAIEIMEKYPKLFE